MSEHEKKASKDELLGFETEQVKVLLMTFEIPRRVYHSATEWTSVGNAWRKYLLSAGETGTDDIGEYQVFSLSPKGVKLLGWNDAE